MNSPRISVVIPAYNAASTIAETLDSVLAQTLPPAEVLVIDDGSTDDTAAVLAEYGAKVRVIRQSNQGLSGARNRGMDEATGDYIAFIDADDLWLPDKLQKQAALAERMREAVCHFTWFEHFGDGAPTPPPPTRDATRVWNDPFLAFYVVVLPSAAMVRASAKARFFPGRQDANDLMYFADLAREGSFCLLNEPLVRYRQSQVTMSRQRGVVTRGWENLFIWASQREDEGHPGLLPAVRERLLESVTTAKYRRDWAKYWELRSFALAHWPSEIPIPSGLSERIGPPALYRLRDAWDHWLGRGTSARAKSANC